MNATGALFYGEGSLDFSICNFTDGDYDNYVDSNGGGSSQHCNNGGRYGVRPVIIISESDIGLS